MPVLTGKDAKKLDKEMNENESRSVGRMCYKAAMASFNRFNVVYECEIPEIVIGIDPDLKKSGVAKKPVKQGRDQRNKGIVLDNLTLWDLFEDLVREQYRIKRVYIEAGWLNKAGLTFAGLCRARDAGMNHAIGKTIEGFCKQRSIPYKLVKPTTKKWTHAEFRKIIGRPELKRSNQEQRDAARLIVGF